MNSDDIFLVLSYIVALVLIKIALNLLWAGVMMLWDPHNLRHEEARLLKLLHEYKTGRLSMAEIKSQDPFLYIRFGLGHTIDGIPGLVSVPYISPKLRHDMISSRIKSR